MKKRRPFFLGTLSFQLDNSGVNRANYIGGNDSEVTMEQLNKGETPAGVRIVDYQSVGIDAYDFLSK